MRFWFLVVALVLPALAPAQTAREIAIAKQVLGPLQARSFAANREFCGIIGVGENGQAIASNPRAGRENSCSPRDPVTTDDFVASYHTHGAFSFDAKTEIPSPDDVYSDMEEGVNGWVSTPGGRLWFINGETGTIRQICGLRCLPQDPDFVPGFMGPIPQIMTLRELERYFDE